MNSITNLSIMWQACFTHRCQVLIGKKLNNELQAGNWRESPLYCKQ